MSELKYLCSPTTVRGKTYKNRILTAPVGLMVIFQDGSFLPGESHAVFVERARAAYVAAIEIA